MSQVRASKQSQGGCKGRMSELRERRGGLPPSRGPDPEGSRMGGRAHLSGGGWQQQYGPDYKEGIDSISTHIKNGHQQEKL